MKEMIKDYAEQFKPIVNMSLNLVYMAIGTLLFAFIASLFA